MLNFMDNTTNESLPNDIVLDKTIPNFLTISYITTCVLAAVAGAINITLNGFVLKCLIRGATARNFTIAFILHNAIADTMTGVFTIYHEIYNILLYSNFRECIFRNACICGFVLGSMFIIMGLNIERYLQITQPLKYTRIIRPGVVNSYLALAWTLVIGLSIAPGFMWIGQPHVDGICGFFVVLTDSYVFAVCIIMFTIISLQIAMYIHIFAIAMTKVLQDRKKVAPIGNGGSIQLWWKPAKVVLIIVGANVCTLVPVAIYMFMVAYGRFYDYTDKEKEILLTYIAAPCFANSVLNPILYSFQIKEVKTAFKKTFCFSRFSRTTKNTTTSTSINVISLHR